MDFLKIAVFTFSLRPRNAFLYFFLTVVIYSEDDIKAGKLKEKKKKLASSHKGQKAEFDLILKKAMVIYNYDDEKKDAVNKKDKIRSLHKLLEWIAESDRKFVDNILRPYIDRIMDMITTNIFRPLPAKKAAELDATDEGAQFDEVQDKSWPTLIVIYEILLHIIKHPAISESTLKHFLTESYIQNLLDLFESNNANERDYLKQIVHKLYAKVIKRRKTFRKMFNNQFISLVYERPTSNGANEILDIYSSIISGFAVPLRPEHVDFFKHFLTPLLKVQTCSNFYEELLRCILIFLNKDKNLSKTLLNTILEFWPYGNTAKELGFLITLYEAMDFIADVDSFEDFLFPLFKRIAQCLNSEHVQVIDRCMTFFERDSLLNIIKVYAEDVFPIIVPPIERQLKEHWHEALKVNFKDLKSILREVDPKVYDSTAKSEKAKVDAKISKRVQLDNKWKILEQRIKQAQPSFEPPCLPFQSNTLVSDFNDLYSSVGKKDQLNQN